MATTSTVSAVKVQLLALLVADLPSVVSDVQVTYSHPGEELRQTACFLGRVHAGTQEYRPNKAAGARKPRRENYIVDVWFVVSRAGQTGQSAEDVAFDLFAKLEDSIALDPGLGLGNPNLYAGIDEFEVETAVDLSSGGWTAILRVGVNVDARLT